MTKKTKIIYGKSKHRKHKKINIAQINDETKGFVGSGVTSLLNKIYNNGGTQGTLTCTKKPHQGNCD